MVERRLVSVGTGPGRQFARLASLALDLDLALRALQMLEQIEDDSELSRNLRGHLIESAIIAYWRCCSASDAKTLLRNVLELSDELGEAHARARAWRNHVVAHTDSGMRRTVALVLLERDSGQLRARDTSSVTVGIDESDEDVSAFRHLVEEVQKRVQYKQDQLGARVIRRLSPHALAALWDRPITSTGIEELEFPQFDPTRPKQDPFMELSISLSSTSDNLPT